MAPVKWQLLCSPIFQLLQVLLRLETAREESKRMADFDYVVVNADGQLDRTVDMIAAIIDAEKSRVHPREPKL